MRILIVGEGPHDIGYRDAWDHRLKIMIDLPGWLQILLEKLRLPTVPIEVMAARRSEILLTDRDRRRNKPLPPGHGERALACMFRAAAGNYDVVIFMADADTPDDAKWREHHKDIEEGFSRGPSGPLPVICLPKAASESWLLADLAAWKAVGLRDITILPNKPEYAWGKRNDPNSHHPKHDFERAAKMSQLRGDGRGQRVEVMEHAEPNAISQSCPVSFASFWEECAAAGFAAPPRP
ncbi:MAG TPA: hypothetical protein VME47_23225 [Acetobacteraceae bacterium]|nr:hypothetical protein [Acetobacteraceae bacterium]